MITRYVFAAALSFGALFGGLIPLQEAHAETHRYLVVIANNRSLGDKIPALHYADDDGARYFELLAKGAREAHLLTTFDEESQELYPHLVDRAKPPTRENLLSSLTEIQEKIEASRRQGAKTVLHVIFAGHGEIDESAKKKAYFSLLDERWSQRDMIEKVIAPQWADYTHLIVDACNAFFLVHGRGSWQNDQVEDQNYTEAVQRYMSLTASLSRYPRTGILLSTAGAQEVHEWSRYRAGVFSHQLRSALVGAADVDQDGQLRYDEIEAYIGAANAAVPTPKARLSITARAPGQKLSEPLFVSRDITPEVTLEIPAGQPGHYVLEDERGLRYADVTTVGDRDLKLALVAGERPGTHYFLKWHEQETRIDLGNSRVLSENLTWHPQSHLARSAVSEAFRLNLFAVPFSAAFYEGYRARSTQLQTNRALPPSQQTAAQDLPPLALEAGYALSSGFSGGNLEQAAKLRVRYGRSSGLFGHATLEGGLTPNDASSIYRFGVNVGGGYGLPVWEDFLVLGAEASLGHLWAEERGGETSRSDRSGIRGDTRAFLDIHLMPRWTLILGGGASMNVVSVLDKTDEEYLLKEEAKVQYGGDMRLRYTF